MLSLVVGLDPGAVERAGVDLRQQGVLREVRRARRRPRRLSPPEPESASVSGCQGVVVAAAAGEAESGHGREGGEEGSALHGAAFRQDARARRVVRRIVGAFFLPASLAGQARGDHDTLQQWRRRSRRAGPAAATRIAPPAICA